MNTSIEEANGSSAGFSGHIHGFNADAEARLAEMMMKIGRWVEKESGMFLGHIKMAVIYEGKGVTLNLTDLDEGVLHHGSLMPKQKVDFDFMAAVTDVDEGELEHVMLHAIEDSGVDFCLDEHECSCGHHHGHDHEHHHEHEHHHHDHEEHEHEHHDHEEHDHDDDHCCDGTHEHNGGHYCGKHHHINIE